MKPVCSRARLESEGVGCAIFHSRELCKQTPFFEHKTMW